MFTIDNNLIKYMDIWFGILNQSCTVLIFYANVCLEGVWKFRRFLKG